MVVVIELAATRPPVGTIGCEGMAAAHFEGWLDLIGAIERLLDAEDVRLARAVAEALDRGIDPTTTLSAEAGA